MDKKLERKIDKKLNTWDKRWERYLASGVDRFKVSFFEWQLLIQLENISDALIDLTETGMKVDAECSGTVYNTN